MKTYYYEFEDGYYCYYRGEPSEVDVNAKESKHGKVIHIVELCYNKFIFSQTK